MNVKKEDVLNVIPVKNEMGKREEAVQAVTLTGDGFLLTTSQLDYYHYQPKAKSLHNSVHPK